MEQVVDYFELNRGEWWRCWVEGFIGGVSSFWWCAERLFSFAVCALRYFWLLVVVYVAPPRRLVPPLFRLFRDQSWQAILNFSDAEFLKAKVKF